MAMAESEIGEKRTKQKQGMGYPWRGSNNLAPPTTPPLAREALSLHPTTTTDPHSMLTLLVLLGREHPAIRVGSLPFTLRLVLMSLMPDGGGPHRIILEGRRGDEDNWGSPKGFFDKIIIQRWQFLT